MYLDYFMDFKFNPIIFSIERINGLLDTEIIKLPCVKLQDAPRFPGTEACI